MTPRTPEQSQRIREARREQILDAALGIFAEKGLHDTKVSEIAARAGVSQGTVYWYFDSKKELFKAVFRDRVEALFQPVFAIALDDTRSASSKLLGITRALLELAAARDEIIFVFIQTVATREVANIVAYDLADYYRQTLGLVTPLFECLGHPDPDAAASIYAAVLDGLMVRHILGPDLVDPERDMAQLKEMFNLQEE